jgi:teichuronic acid biosynthesis glycosyltransferase TuaC
MKVLVATAMYPTPENPAFGSFVRTQVESLQAVGIDAEPFVLAGKNRKLMYAQAIPQLRTRMRVGDVDLIHAHYSYVGAVARSQHRVPVVLTFHGDDLLGTVGPSGRTTVSSRLVQAGGRALARRVDAVIVQSEEMAAQLAGADHVHVIPHEVDLDLFAPVAKIEARAELGLAPDRRYLLFASSRTIPVKNFPLAREAANLSQRRFPTAELVVVEREPQTRLALYMSACDVLVFPSFREGSPNIVKQAMACNLPIIATDVGDVRDIIGETPGCIVAARDAEAFTNAICDLLDRDQRTAGRDAVLRFAPKVVANRVTALYDSVLSAYSSGRPAGIG